MPVCEVFQKATARWKANYKIESISTQRKFRVYNFLLFRTERNRLHNSFLFSGVATVQKTTIKLLLRLQCYLQEIRER